MYKNIKALQDKITLECSLSDINEKKKQNERLLKLQQLTKTKKEKISECNQMKALFEQERECIDLELSKIENVIKNEQNEQEMLLLQKIALQTNVSQCTQKLHNLRIEKKKFSEMRDLSQFKPIAVFYVLQYLEITDFISCILCCRAWYFSLNKPSYFRVLQRNIICNFKQAQNEKKNDSKSNELVSSKTKLKRINHAVMQLKIEPKKVGNKKSKKNVISTPRPDDIYTQCMQQLQRVIAQSEQDKEELIDRVKAQMGIMRFMQTSMYGKMRELAELRVRKWELRNKSRNEFQIEKKQLANEIRDFEARLSKNRMIISNMKEHMKEQAMIREKKIKFQNDYQAIKSGTTNVEQSNELRKLKQQTKKLAQVMVKIRKEIPKRKQEIKKYKNRVELLQSQYEQYSHQPLP